MANTQTTSSATSDKSSTAAIADTTSINSSTVAPAPTEDPTVYEPKMQMYVAPTTKGIQFLCSLVNEIPSDAIEIDDDTYKGLMAADAKGASLAIQSRKAVALDWEGTVIDLTKITATSSFSKPATLAQLATVAFQSAREKFQDLQMMGQTFGPNTQKYMQALNAIITGEDTTSTELPTPPSDYTK